MNGEIERGVEENLGYLKGSSMFLGIPEEQIDPLLRSVRVTVRTWDKGEVVRHAGDEMDYFGIVLSGSVQASLPQAWREQIVERFGACDSFAEAVPVAFRRTPVTITALEDVRIACIKPTDIAASSHAFAALLQENLTQEMSKKLVHLSRKLAILGEPRLRSRIAMYLAEQPVNDAGEIELVFSYRELADYLGVNSAALSREIGRMQDEGILAVGKRTFKVLKSLDDY